MERILLSKGERILFGVVAFVFFVGMYGAISYGFDSVNEAGVFSTLKQFLITFVYMITGAILFVFGCALVLAAVLGSFLSPE